MAAAPQRRFSTPDRRTNAEGVALIKQWEASGEPRLHAYLDTLAKPPVWTIGYGHTRTAHEGLEIDEEKAEALLRGDLREAERIVSSFVLVPLSDEEFAALVSFVFNVGPGKKGVKDGLVSLRSGKPSTLLVKLNAGDYEGAQAEFAKWANAGGKFVRGLANRRAAEAALFGRGSFVASQYVEPEAPTADRPLSERPVAQGAIAGTTAAAGTAVIAAADKIGTLGDDAGTIGIALTITLTLAGLGFVLYSIVKGSK